jgi:ubiquinone/menaquinone biosynthesis C-methylase UbiE
MPKFGTSWIPTQSEHIKLFFEMCPISSSDVVYDLGSGDGRLLFAALEKGAAKCVGIEMNPECVKISQEAAKNLGVEDKIEFIEIDFMEVDLSEASVVLCYLFPKAYTLLRSKFEKELKPGTRVVMETFPIPGWKPLKEDTSNGVSFSFYTYIMPPEKNTVYETPVKPWDYLDYYRY